MQRPKAFFFLCAGVFLLALSYHLGARSAGAQGGSIIAVGQVLGGSNGSNSVGVVGRTLYGRHEGTNGGVSTAPVPGTESIVAVSADFGYLNGPRFYALLANGDCQDWTPSGGWILEGNVLGNSPVGATRASWGQLKARYR